MTFQFSIWDKFRDLENLPATNFSNLVHLVGHLLKTKSLPLSILKVCVTDKIIESNESANTIVSIWYLKKYISSDSEKGFMVPAVRENSQMSTQCELPGKWRHSHCLCSSK